MSNGLAWPYRCTLEQIDDAAAEVHSVVHYRAWSSAVFQDALSQIHRQGVPVPAIIMGGAVLDDILQNRDRYVVRSASHNYVFEGDYLGYGWNTLGFYKAIPSIAPPPSNVFYMIGTPVALVQRDMTVNAKAVVKGVLVSDAQAH